jgi:hypothetical protein
MQKTVRECKSYMKGSSEITSIQAVEISYFVV